MKQERFKNRALCLWFPQWPLQRLRLARPELKRHELVLYGQFRGCCRVVASSKQTVPGGMPLAEAKALTKAHFEQHDPDADQAALLQLAAWCEQFSPIVGIEQPDNLCLNVTGLGPLFGGEPLLVQQIVRALHRRGFVVQLGMADTLGAAWAIAHFGNTAGVQSDKTAKADPLSALPVAALRLNGECEILTELGIQQIGQLLALPRDALASRFHPQLLFRLDQAIGLIPETIVSHRPPPEITAEMQLEYPADDRRAVDIILSQLIDHISHVLVERQQGAIQMDCTLSCELGKPIHFVVGLFRASAQAKHLFEMTRLQLDRVVLPGPVAAIRIAVLTAAPLETWQQDLFEPSHCESRRHVGLLADRLSNRLGREAVVRAVPQPEAQPELAFRYEPIAGSLPRKIKPQRWKSLPRPLRLESEPRPLEVLAVAPDGPPIQFQFHGLHRIEHAKGPERIQTGWWRGHYVQRDYYRIETTTGKRFWLFRRLSDGKWFLHGAFD